MLPTSRAVLRRSVGLQQHGVGGTDAHKDATPPEESLKSLLHNTASVHG